MVFRNVSVYVDLLVMDREYEVDSWVPGVDLHVGYHDRPHIRHQQRLCKVGRVAPAECSVISKF